MIKYNRFIFINAVKLARVGFILITIKIYPLLACLIPLELHFNEMWQKEKIIRLLFAAAIFLAEGTWGEPSLIQLAMINPTTVASGQQCVVKNNKDL